MLGRRATGPVVRDRLLLVFVVAATTAFVWINDLRVALGAFALAVAALAVARKLRSRLVLFVLSTTMLLYFLGNWLFSPLEAGGIAFGPLQMNALGVYRGATAAFKRGAMIGLSLAWIMATPLPRLSATLSILPGRWWLALFLRNLQIIRRDVVLARYSLMLRSRSARIHRVVLRLTQLRLAIQSAVLRAFHTIPRLAYAAEATRGSGIPPPCVLELENVSTRYDREAVLRDVNLRFEPGELVYVDGASKSGRTTLLRTIAGYIPKITGEIAGEVRLNGVSTRSMPLRELARFVRYVPSEAERSLLGLTVVDEIALYAPDEETAATALGAMGLEHLRGQETSSLSGGEQVRLLIAGILAAPPSVVAFDAPLEQLDASGRHDFLWALSELRARNSITVIIADNQHEELRGLQPRVLHLSGGTVAEQGDMPPVFDDPLMPCHAPLFDAASVEVVAAARNICVVLSERTILHNVSFEIRSGECVAVVGPNGSGKTTAMLALAGVLPLAQGAVQTKGLIGYVFQDSAAQMVEITAGDEVLVEPRFARWNAEKAEDYRASALEWAGAEPLTWTIDLHGQVARLLSVTAMLPEKRIMAFDEPSIGVDAEGVSALLARFAKLLDGGMAIFVVTHDPRIAQFAHRTLCFSDGTLVAEEAMFGDRKFGEANQHAS